MDAVRDVAVLVGSLRKESINRKVARALGECAPPSLKLRFVEIGELPLFNQDDEAAPTAAVTAFKEQIARADAVLFVTPEYNRSVPGVLKNALDVGSRPYGQSVWNGKPGAVVSASQGGIGGFGANHHLRQALVFLNVPAMAQPEGLCRRSGQAVRCRRQADQRRHARLLREIHAGIRGVDREEQDLKCLSMRQSVCGWPMPCRLPGMSA